MPEDRANRANAAQQQVVILNFPPIVGYEGLSQLLNRSIPTLQADRCRHPASVPPACTPPGTRNPLWLVSDVMNWLAQYRQAATPPAPRRRPGCPTKAEEIARRARREQEGGA